MIRWSRHIQIAEFNPLGGIGGGGIVSSVWVITAEIVEVRKRAIWSQALSITWSASAIAGPIIGGIFSGMIACFDLLKRSGNADIRHFKGKTQAVPDGAGDVSAYHEPRR